MLVVAFVVLPKVMAVAQCAMCRASVENNVSNGETTVGASLNMGILYLFVAPYLLAAVIGFLWYRNSKRKKLVSTT
ncbi:hypothetical protein [Echinicola vietnamensis]|uniref:Uncharacterized protein n=1 Tax=Echinicola vietnamensis (strain DSM 17526 / LMG 23754 / KMM 6221) TaxID=926556 RepID=L0FYI8_ECHVK|nr:hypothetical protein Echvi_2111 [Echinicola vietnamensis DSM 17526]